MFKSNHTEYDIQTNLEFYVQFYSNQTQIANSFSQTNSNNTFRTRNKPPKLSCSKKLNQVVRANSAKNYGTRNLIVTV